MFRIRLHHEHPNIRGYRIDYEELQQHNPELLARLGHGWTALNTEMLILDDIGGPESRGTIVTEPSQIKELKISFEQLLKLAATV